MVSTLFLIYYFGVLQRQILEKKAAGVVFHESFESGTVSSLPVGWTVSSSNAQWGAGWGENNGSARIISAPLMMGIPESLPKALELIGHHVSGTSSRFGMNHTVPGLGLNKIYKVQAEVFVPSGSNSQMVEVLMTGWTANFSKKFQVVDGNNLKINADLKNQWQTVSADFVFTDPAVDFSKVYVTLAVWNDQKAVFGRVKVVEKGAGSQIASFDFSTGVPSALPAGWEFSTSSAAWGGNWGGDLGSAQIQDRIAKSGKAAEAVSYQQDVSKSTLSQICHPVTLNPTKKYRISADIYWNRSDWKDSPSLVLLQSAEPNTIVAKVSKWESGGALVDEAKIGSWQTPFAETNFQGLTDTAFHVCAQAVSGASAIFDNVDIQDMTAPANTPTPTPTLTPTPTPVCKCVNGYCALAGRCFNLQGGNQCQGQNECRPMTPTPTNSPNTFSKTVIIKLKGVEKTNDATVNAFRKANPAKINFEIVRKSDRLKKSGTAPLTSTYDETTGNYSISLTAIPNDFLAPSILYLKTTKGLRAKFCSNTQAERCDATKERTSSINFAPAGNLNLTGYALPAGDVNQDSVLNGQDIVLMIEELNKVPITSRNLQYDLDENGLVLGADYATMLGSMTVYDDE